jgi:nitrogen fixation protein
MEKKTYIINHIPIKQMWLEENIILIKDVQTWVDKKMLKNTIKKVLCNISKD